MSRDSFWTNDKLLPSQTHRDFTSSEISSTHPDYSLPMTPACLAWEEGIFHPLELPPDQRQDLTSNSRILIAATVSFQGCQRTAFRGFYDEALASHQKSGEPDAPYRSFYTVMPRYENLTKDQFRFYLSWREGIRRGEYVRVDFGYLYLYIYEQINLTGWIQPQQVLANLLTVWKAYRKDFPMMDRQMADWILDLCILWKMALPLGEILDIFCDSELRVLPLSGICALVDGLLGGKVPMTDAHEDFLIKRFCTYRYRHSRYYKENGEFACRMEEARMRLFPKLLESGVLFPTISSSPMKITRPAFSGAVVSAEKRRIIELDCYPNWGEEIFVSILGDCMKAIDNATRGVCGIRSRLSGIHLSEPIASLIAHLAADEKPVKIEQKVFIPKPPVQVDLEKARLMETIAWETTRLLTAYQDTENEDDIPSQPPPEPIAPQESDGWVCLLTETERICLYALAKQDTQTAGNEARKQNLFLVSVVDTINEKALSFYGEPICDLNSVFEEYADEILATLTSERNLS